MEAVAHLLKQCLFLSLLIMTVAKAQAQLIDQRKEDLLKKNPRSGPNCWNAVLYVNGIVPLPMLTSSHHARTSFDRYCKKIAISPEKAPVGSVIRFRTGEDAEEVHAFIKTAENKYFQKRGNEASAPYEIVTYDEVYQLYGKDANCDNSSPCFWSEEVLDCSEAGAYAPLSSFNQLPKELKQLIQLVSNYAMKTIDINQLRSSLQTYSTNSFSRVANELLKVDRNSLLHILDLYQTVRFALDEESETADELRADIDRLIWVIAETVLDRKDLDEGILNSFYDFTYGASGASGNPDKLARKIVRMLSKGKSEYDSGRLLQLMSNPKLNYGGAEEILLSVLIQFDKSPTMPLMEVLSGFFANSGSIVNDRAGLFKKFVRQAKNFAKPNELYIVVDALFKNRTSKIEKLEALSLLVEGFSREEKYAMKQNFLEQYIELGAD